MPSLDYAPVTYREFDGVGVLTFYLGLLFFVPARWVVPGLGAAGRPAGLFALGLLFLWVVLRLLPAFRTRTTWMHWAVLVNFLALLASYGLAYDRGLPPVEALSADRAMLSLFAMSGVILVGAESVSTIDRLERLTKNVTYMSSLVVLVAFVQFFAKFDIYSVISFPGLVLNSDVSGLGERGANSFVRAKGSMLHPIEFAVTTAMVLPLAVHHALHESDRTRRRWRYSIVALHGLGSVLAVSRSAVIALAAVLAVLFWAWSPLTRVRAAVVGFIFAVGVRALVPGLLGTLLSLFRNWNNDPSVRGRTSDYEIVKEFVQDRPWFGRGIGTFIPSEYIVLDNAYLGRLASTGFVGLASLVGLLVVGLMYSRRCAMTHEDEPARHLAVAFGAIVVVALVSGGTFDFYFFPTATGILLIGLGGIAGLAYVSRGEGSQPGSAQLGGLLRLAYRRSFQNTAWWQRIDPREPDPASQEAVSR